MAQLLWNGNAWIDGKLGLLRDEHRRFHCTWSRPTSANWLAFSAQRTVA